MVNPWGGNTFVFFRKANTYDVNSSLPVEPPIFVANQIVSHRHFFPIAPVQEVKGLEAQLVTGLHAAYPGYAAKLPRVQSIRTLESLVCDTLTTEGL
jgi:hypothetical protein